MDRPQAQSAWQRVLGKDEISLVALRCGWVQLILRKGVYMRNMFLKCRLVLQRYRPPPCLSSLQLIGQCKYWVEQC